MTKRELAYFKAADAVSELSNHPNHKLGAVVVLGHRIVSSGCNSDTKGHPIQARLDNECFGTTGIGKRHAEFNAILPLMKDNVDLRGAAIYVSRKHKDGKLAMARPCSRCGKLIRQCGIRKVYYSVENGYAQEKW